VRTKSAFPEAPGQPIIISPGHWAELTAHPEFRDKKRADQVSYLWDTILQEFGNAVHRGEAPNPLNAPLERLETMGRRLASETRFRRRELSTALLTGQVNIKRGEARNRTCLSRRNPSVAYVFCFFPQTDESSYDQYRNVRRGYSMLYGVHTLGRANKVSEAVVVSTDMGHAEEVTFDFGLIRREDLTEAAKAEASEFAQERGWAADIRDLNWMGQNSREFPRTSKRKAEAERQAGKVQLKKARKTERAARKSNRKKR
jgi:hypothetical protein